MANKNLSDKEAKAILLKWPTRTTKLWPLPGGTGCWIRGQPISSNESGLRLSSPGASLFRTQPDALWAHFRRRVSCDVVAVEVCGNAQNLNDKRSRYMPVSHSLVLHCTKAWLTGSITAARGAKSPRWKISGIYRKVPVNKQNIAVPVRHLRVLYALPNDLYEKWIKENVPAGHEYFCPHSSLDSYNSQKMQAFLKQLSSASQFYVQP